MSSTLHKPGDIRVELANGAGDIAIVRELFSQYAAALDFDLEYQGFGQELAMLPGDYAPPGGALLLARERSGAVPGCIAFRPLNAENCCELKRLFVQPAGRGKGIGDRLVADAVARASRLGYHEMRLDTVSSMTSAIQLYRRHGFVPMKAYYELPVPSLYFRKYLPG